MTDQMAPDWGLMSSVATCLALWSVIQQRVWDQSSWHRWAATASTACVARLGAVADWRRISPMANAHNSVALNITWTINYKKRTYRPSSSRHLDRHSAEQNGWEAGTRTNVVTTERVLAVYQQSAAVIAMVVRQLCSKGIQHRRYFSALCVVSMNNNKLNNR